MTSISVAMCTFDGARFLPEQLESIAAQVRLPDELVVVDDGSSDATMEVLSAFAATAPFEVRIDRNERTLGSTKNFEVALGRCHGDVLVLCDQDDTWQPGWLQAVESTFRRRPDVGLVFTDADLIDDSSRPLGSTLWERLRITPAQLDVVRSPAAVDLLLEASTIAGATMAFRSRFRPLVLPIPDDLPLLHDAWIAVLVSAAAGVLPIHPPLVRYRLHGAQQNGAPPPPAPAGPGATAEAWARLLAVGERVHERLIAHEGSFEVAAAADRIDDRLAHIRFRTSLPARRLARVGGAARELVAGRYHRFSNGLRSMGKDLLGAR